MLLPLIPFDLLPIVALVVSVFGAVWLFPLLVRCVPGGRRAPLSHLRITIGVAKSQFFRRVIEKLDNSKAVVKLNLLRILRTVCDVHPNRAILVERYGIYELVVRLKQNDGAVLVRELAREIEPTLAPALKPLRTKISLKGLDSPKSVIAPKKRVRRTASEASAPLLSPSVSQNGTTRGLRNSGNGKSKPMPSRHRLGDISWQPSEQ